MSIPRTYSKLNGSTECQNAFEEIKNIYVKLDSDTLRPKNDIIVASDPGNLGLGAVILHKESNSQVKPIAIASKTELLTEKGYRQIEKRGFRDNFCGKKVPSIHLWKKLYTLNEPSTVNVNFWFKKKMDSYIYCK